MPKDKPTETARAATKEIRQCTCGATVFQGPFVRGPIENGQHIERERLYQCVNCHHVWAVDDRNWPTVEVPAA